MSSIEISESEAAVVAYALQRHIAHVDKLLVFNSEWPTERRKMLQLFTRLKRAALPIGPDDADDDWRIYEFY
jgi:hypothetical protein